MIRLRLSISLFIFGENMKKLQSFLLKYRHEVILVLMVLTVLILRLITLFSSPYALGADGYYYANQIRHFFDHGYYFDPDSSVILRFLTYFSLLFKNPVISNKIAVALMSALTLIPAYQIGKRLAGKTAGLVMALILSSSHFSFLFVMDYVKNLGGILFFLFFLDQIILVLKKGEKVKDYIVLLLCFLLVLFSHKLMAGLALLFLMMVLAYKLRKKAILLASLGLGAVLAVLGAGLAFPNIINIHDFVRLQGLFSIRPQLAPLSYIRMQQLPWLINIEVILLILSPLSLVLSWKQSDKISKVFMVFMLILYALIINPFFVFGGDNLAFRMFILLPLPASAFIGAALSRIRLVTLSLISVVMLVYLFYSSEVIRKGSHFDYALYHDLLPLMELPDDHLLIVHLGFDYFYCYREMGDAYHFLSEEKHTNRTVMRMAYGIDRDDFKSKMKHIEDVYFMPGGYTLMKESQWQQYLALVPDQEKKNLLNWKNPHIHRQSYMKDKDRFQPQEP